MYYTRAAGAGLLVILMMWSSGIKTWAWLWFTSHRENIAARHCRWRNQPRNTCQGACYFRAWATALEKSGTSASEQPFPSWVKIQEQPAVSVVQQDYFMANLSRKLKPLNREPLILPPPFLNIATPPPELRS